MVVTTISPASKSGIAGGGVGDAASEGAGASLGVDVGVGVGDSVGLGVGELICGSVQAEMANVRSSPIDRRSISTTSG